MALELALAVAVIAFSMLFYVVFTLRNSKSEAFMKQVSGPPRLPLLGNALDLNRPNEGKQFMWIFQFVSLEFTVFLECVFVVLTEVMQFEWPAKYGPRYSFAIANRNYFSSTKPSDIEVRTAEKFDSFWQYELSVFSLPVLMFFAEIAIICIRNQ